MATAALVSTAVEKKNRWGGRVNSDGNIWISHLWISLVVSPAQNFLHFRRASLNRPFWANLK